MRFCKEFPYKEPLNIHSGISIWTNVGSGVMLLKPIKTKDGLVDEHCFIQVPGDEYRYIFNNIIRGTTVYSRGWCPISCVRSHEPNDFCYHTH
jgi:hypothetical protein